MRTARARASPPDVEHERAEAPDGRGTNEARAQTSAKAYVVVRHLLDGRYRIYFGSELIAEASGTPPTDSTGEERSITVAEVKRGKARKKRRQG